MLPQREEKQDFVLLMARRENEDGAIELLSFHETRLADIWKHISTLKLSWLTWMRTCTRYLPLFRSPGRNL